MNKRLCSLRAPFAIMAIAVILGAAGCETTSVASRVQFTMMSQEDQAMAPDSLVQPGSTLKLQRILLADEQGRSMPPPGAEDISVEVKGGTYDAATDEVSFSADRAQVPPEGYEVVVVHADGARSVQRFRPDFARIDGPDPKDVASFNVDLRWRNNGALHPIPQGTALIPGEEYAVHMEAVDRHGRKFSSTDAGFPIPANRVGLTLTGFVASETNEYGLIAQPEPDEGRYGIRAVYGDGGGPAKNLSFQYDPAIGAGPPPETVAALDILGDLADDGPISPGAVKRLKIRVTDLSGRSWTLGLEGKGSHLTNEYPLPASRVEMAAENATYDPGTSNVLFSADARAMLGKQYRITAKYGEAGPEFQKSFEPDFLSIVPLMEMDELTYDGVSGRAGRAGRDGQQGSRGNDSNRVLGRGGGGRPGGHGTAGQNGARGSPGPNLRVIAREVRTINAQERLVLFEVRTPGMRPEYYVRSIDAPPVTIITRGGSGGDGGNGGTGGDGGNGGAGYYSGDGGDGGNAGGGGDGGDGGNGGTIDLILTTHELEKAFVLDSRGGDGGAGGEEGIAGQPGIPGSVDSWATSDEVKLPKDAPPPELGAYGNEGNIGYTGRAGHNGLPGMVELSVDESQASALVRRVPEEIRDAILY